MTGQVVHECGRGEKGRELRMKIISQVLRLQARFIDNFGAAVNEIDQILDVMASQKGVAAAAVKCFEFY
jgi:hypothetical protein